MYVMFSCDNVNSLVIFIGRLSSTTLRGEKKNKTCSTDLKKKIKFKNLNSFEVFSIFLKIHKIYHLVFIEPLISLMWHYQSVVHLFKLKAKSFFFFWNILNHIYSEMRWKLTRDFVNQCFEIVANICP